jgi:hypothetical protein
MPHRQHTLAGRGASIVQVTSLNISDIVLQAHFSGFDPLNFLLGEIYAISARVAMVFRHDIRPLHPRPAKESTRQY